MILVETNEVLLTTNVDVGSPGSCEALLRLPLQRESVCKDITLQPFLGGATPLTPLQEYFLSCYG